MNFAHGHLPEEPPATEFEGVDAKGGEFGYGEDADDFYGDNDDLDPYDLDELY